MPHLQASLGGKWSDGCFSPVHSSDASPWRERVAAGYCGWRSATTALSDAFAHVVGRWVDELQKTLVEKTGLPEDTVRQAMPMLSGFLKGMTPPEARGAIDQFVGSQPPVEGISSVNDVDGLTTLMSDKLGIPKR